MKIGRGPVDVGATREETTFPAVIETLHRAPGGGRGLFSTTRRSGSWISYALGTANIKNLPTFVNLGRASSPVQLTGGYLGAGGLARHPVPAGGRPPIPNLKAEPGAGPPPSATGRCRRSKS